MILEDRIQFREEHKMLLSAQAQTQGGLESLRGDVERIGCAVESLADNVEGLAATLDAMRAHFDQRLTRLGG